MKKFLLALLLTSSTIHARDVLISFDGSAILGMWRDTIDFAKANDVKYTYFVSSPFFISESQAKDHPYWAIDEIGKPLLAIRKDAWQSGTNERWDLLYEASKNGHEIASHLCGHYNGENWTYEQWMKEFHYFQWSMGANFVNAFDDHAIVGVRAPYLGVNRAYFRALKDSGYKWDSSLVFVNNNKYTGTSVPIRQIEMKDGSNRLNLPFDCNFVLYKAPEGMTKEQIYFDSLCYDYLHSDPSLPLQICLHFEPQEGEPYLNAMKKFVLWAKDKKPSYLTYSEYAEWMEEKERRK